MIASPPKSEFETAMRDSFSPAQGGIVEMVDHFLAASHGLEVSLEFRDNVCQVTRVVQMPQVKLPDFTMYLSNPQWNQQRSSPARLKIAAETLQIPVPAAVVRSMLSRIAVLCNRTVPDSVSLYGGTGDVEVVVDKHPMRFHVQFTNTVSDKKLVVSS